MVSGFSFQAQNQLITCNQFEKNLQQGILTDTVEAKGSFDI